MRYLGGIFWIFLTLASSPLMANDSQLIIDDYYTFFNPTLHASYFIDTKNELNISDIVHPDFQGKFTSVNQVIPQFGLVSSTIWLKFSIQNLLNTSPYLELENPALDTLKYYLFNNNGDLVHQHSTGNFKQINQREIRSGQLIIDMNLNDQNMHRN